MKLTGRRPIGRSGIIKILSLMRMGFPDEAAPRKTPGVFPVFPVCPART
ncbi:Uncharacterized protein dnm_048260 [Desulfonema magnum]|uniref:Uncharacterized protein n=1 Tax=Desulfonema magnum TaxID=45655 RepID=A0A975BPH4_9BACT|nr:Uncharacterized protein dnm_048260 [Desulfonema magnum]